MNYNSFHFYYIHLNIIVIAVYSGIEWINKSINKWNEQYFIKMNENEWYQWNKLKWIIIYFIFYYIHLNLNLIIAYSSIEWINKSINKWMLFRTKWMKDETKWIVSIK